MGHTRILTVSDGDTRYTVDKWESTSCTPMTHDWHYPAKITNLDSGNRLDRWETSEDPGYAFANMADAIETAIEGLERLIIEHGVSPDEIVVTRHAPFAAEDLATRIDVDADIVDSSQQSIRS